MRRHDIARSIGMSLGIHAAVVLGAIVAFQAAPTRSTSPAFVPDAIIVRLSGSAQETGHRALPQRAPPAARDIEHLSSTVQSETETSVQRPDMEREAVEPPPISEASDRSSDSTSLVQESASRTSDGDVGSAPSSPTGDPMDAYRALVLTALERAKRYPLFARERGVEGTVEIAFIILPDGRVSDPQIVASSQYRILDEAALGMVRRVGILPPPPELAPLRFPARIGYRLDSP